uniref:uncharacterized protein LOC117610843 n=1 Tax=Osmia lignaria TaxID=473952 RepID=UPI001479085E|nr:uncharacterized protein LOC117610843 [Osmia lignaria]
MTKHQNDVKIATQLSCRILGRKYPLTDSCTKYLEIGINILGDNFYPQLVLSDSRNNRLELSIVTWSLLVAEADNVCSFFDDSKDTRLSALGTVAGGAAGIAKAVNDASAARKTLEEVKRHNRVMEGHGLYLAPYKRGKGIKEKKKKRFGKL